MRHPGVGRGGGAVRAAQHGGERPVHVGGEGRLAGGDRGGELRCPVQQLDGRGGPRVAVAGEDEDRVGGARRDAGDGGGGLAEVERLQGPRQVDGVAAEDDGAVVERGPGGDQGVRDVGRRQLRVCREVRAQPGRLVAQRRGVHGGEHEGYDVGARPVGGPRADRLGGRLLDDHVRVRAGDPERRHPRPTRPTHPRPRRRLGRQRDRPRRPVDVRGRLVHVQRRRARRRAASPTPS